MAEYVNANISMPVDLKKRIEEIAERRMSTFSQVLREAASIGLKEMK
jgi:predicted DNA-binding protein